MSTNLGPWVNQRGIFSLDVRNDVFREEHVASAQKWMRMAAASISSLGSPRTISSSCWPLGAVGAAVRDKAPAGGHALRPFIARGLDALNYACYQGARFMVVATPSGLTLAPEGGAHQSISTPLVGMGQPGRDL